VSIREQGTALNRALASKIVESMASHAVLEPVYEEMKEFVAADWQQTLWWLSGSGLPHYFLARLQHSNRDSVLPPAIHVNLSRNFCANQQRVDIMAEEFASLTSRLSDAGVNCAAVRGFELAPQYCPNLWLRTWYTHEYVVSAEQINSASRVVEQAGYSFRRCGFRGELYFAVPEMQTPSKLEEAYSAVFPRMVVLHTQMWDRRGTGIDITVPGDLLQRSVRRRAHGMSFPTLADDDLLAVTLMDTFARVLTYWCKLSWLLEISHFLEVRRSEDIFWENFYGRIADWGKLPQIADFLFFLCFSVFGVVLPEVVRYRVSELSSPLALWTRHYGKRWTLAEYPGSKLSLLVQRELISDRAVWKRTRCQRLFPLIPVRSTSSGSIAMTTERGQLKRKISRLVDRIRFHGPATYTYLRELPRWKRLLDQGS